MEYTEFVKEAVFIARKSGVLIRSSALADPLSAVHLKQGNTCCQLLTLKLIWLRKLTKKLKT
jgi:hypothetical protein